MLTGMDVTEGHRQDLPHYNSSSETLGPISSSAKNEPSPAYLGDARLCVVDPELQDEQDFTKETQTFSRKLPNCDRLRDAFCVFCATTLTIYGAVAFYKQFQYQDFLANLARDKMESQNYATTANVLPKRNTDWPGPSFQADNSGKKIATMALVTSLLVSALGFISLFTYWIYRRRRGAPKAIAPGAAGAAAGDPAKDVDPELGAAETTAGAAPDATAPDAAATAPDTTVAAAGEGADTSAEKSGGAVAAGKTGANAAAGTAADAPAAAGETAADTADTAPATKSSTVNDA